MYFDLRHPTTAFAVAFMSVAVLLAAGCGENPQEPREDLAPEDLTVEFTVEPDHVHILQTEAAFRAAVRTQEGDAVTDFETLEVQRRLVSGDQWNGTEAHLHGSEFEAHHVFTTSGEYRLRVRAEHPGWDEAQVLHEADGTLEVARAHAEAGGYRVEFESFPGHVHQEDTATLRFWVTEQEEDDSGTRPPVEGLSPEIRVTEDGGQGSEHSAEETEAGVYEADHTFENAGDATIGLHFTGSDGNPAEAEFQLPVAEAH